MIVAGRVMPFFTERAVAGSRPRTRRWVEVATFALAVALTLAHLAVGLAGAGALGLPVAVLAAGLAGVQALRLWGWHHAGAWGNPMLAVRYAGYLWLVLELALDALAGLGWLPPFPALHALTAGAFGVFTLGMMTRVTLGHTGREVRGDTLTSVAFVLINAAALARVLPPLVDPSAYATWLPISGTLWMLAFGVFQWVCAPMLRRARIDGRPG